MVTILTGSRCCRAPWTCAACDVADAPCWAWRGPTAQLLAHQWRSFHFDGFCDNLRQSVLLTNAPDDCYHLTLQSLLDHHALSLNQARTSTRRGTTDSAGLTKQPRHVSSVPTDETSPSQIEQLGGISSNYFAVHCDYWSTTQMIQRLCDPSWTYLLKTTQQSSSTAHPATDFADFFYVQTLHLLLLSVTARLSAFDDVTADEIVRLVGKAPTKHCSLDQAPTWLVKRVLPLLADTFAKICNTSFHEGVFPQNVKQALVWPRLKKSTLNPDDLNSYRPTSNLTFLSKVVVRAVAVRLRRHVE